MALGFLSALLCVFLGQALGWIRPVAASDHADPIFLRQLEAGITDLFAFEDGNDLVVIVCVRRNLANGDPISLSPYSYHVHLDLNSEVKFDDPDTLARYGGKVARPSQISEDFTIEFRLFESPKPNPEKWAQSVAGGERLASTMIREWDVQQSGVAQGIDRDPIQIWSGIADDPFIFHRFNRTNCIATVIRIPFSTFPKGRVDYLIWSTSHQFDRQIDHVGRSLRTMLPRFETLNTRHPREHVSVLRQRHASPGPITDLAAVLVSPLFGLRHYDFEPDVMIFTRRKDIVLNEMSYGNGYPNGRKLTDDVAKLCCDQGDCLLYEVSLADAHADGLPRPVSHPKGFGNRFPYLLDPVDETVPFVEPTLRKRTLLILVAIGSLVVVILLLPWVLYLKLRRQHLRLKSVGSK